MENNRRPLAPEFINRIDRNLLLNKPSVWSARTHLVLYYGFLFFILLTALAFLVPDDPRRESPAGSWIGFVSVISFIGLVIYTIYLLRFNVFKRFGVDGPWHRLLAFALYFISIGSFVFFPYVEPYVETIRASNQYTDAELTDDINTINLSIAALEYDSVDHTWRRDTAKVVPNYTETESNDDELTVTTEVITVDTVGRAHTFRMIQIKDLRLELEQTDSVIQLSDSLYLFFHCPSYIYLSPYFGSSVEEQENRLTSIDIYERVTKNYRKPDVPSVQKTLSALKEKYVFKDFEYYSSAHDYDARVRARYFVNETSRSMENINERMHRFDAENLPTLFRIHFYITLALTLLLFIFRHSTPKAFFLGILTALVLFILTALLLAFSYNSEDIWLVWVILYFLLFFIISIFTFQSQVRNLVSGIAINLFVFLLPFIPLSIVGAYYEWRENQPYFRVDEEVRNFHLCLAELAGITLFLVLLVTYIHRLYRRWYASAEE